MGGISPKKLGNLVVSASARNLWREYWTWSFKAAIAFALFQSSTAQSQSDSEKGKKTSGMEIEGEDGSRTQLREGSEIVFGRGNVFNPNDPTVSRRHISFELTTPRVSFQAIGKNPIWVRTKESGEIRAFRRFERGELSVGDLLCVSSKDPGWFSVKKVEDNEGEIGASSCEEERKLGDELELEVSSESELTGNAQDLDLGFDSFDLSNIDPVKAFNCRLHI